MAVRTTTFFVALIIIVVVAILIIIQSSWSIWLTNTVEGDDCDCSGVTDSDLSSLRVFNIIMIIIAIGLIIYAVILYFIPTAEARERTSESFRKRERFTRKAT